MWTAKEATQPESEEVRLQCPSPPVLTHCTCGAAGLPTHTGLSHECCRALCAGQQ